MTTWDDRLETIMTEHGFDTKELGMTAVERQLGLHWKRKTRRIRVGLWGALYAAEFINMLNEDDAVPIVCVIDSNPAYQDKTVGSVPVIRPDQMAEFGVDMAVILSHASRHVIAKSIRESYPGVEVFEIHDELGLEFPFYSPLHQYKDIYDFRQRLNSSADLSERIGSARTLAGKYLVIRDFVHAFAVLEQWAGESEPDSAGINRMLTEIRAIIEDLRARLSVRENPDTAMVLIDSLRDRDVYEEENLPFLREFADRAYSYRNAFSTSTYTTATMISMFQGGLTVDDRYDQTKHVDFTKSELLQYLAGKRFSFMSNSGTVKFIHDGGRVEHHQNERGVSSKAVTEQPKFYGISSLYFWNLATKMADSEDPVFALIHVLEAHVPFIGGNQQHWIQADAVRMVMDYFKDRGSFPLGRIVDQRNESLRYVDSQLAFYIPLFPRMNWAIFGDHGISLGDHQVFGHIFTWHDDMIHVPLIISIHGAAQGEHHGLVSLKDFGPMLISHLEGEVPQMSAEAVFTQREPIYNRVFHNDREFVEGMGEKYLRGFKLVRTGTEKYVLYDNGDEEFYVLPHESDDLSGDSAFAERMNMVKKHMTDRTFPYLTESTVKGGGRT